jgi:TetR/AcrR family transcriptional regulator
MRPLSKTVAAKVPAAADLFAERGLDGATMSDVAAATGIPRATLYYHFASKQEIFSYMCGTVLDALYQAVADALQSNGNAATRLRKVVRAHLEFYAANSVALTAMHLDLGRGVRRPEVVARTSQSYLTPVAKLLEEGHADGSLRKVDDPRAVAAAILGATTIAAEQRLRPNDPNSVTRVERAITSVFLTGLAAKKR